MTIDGTIMFAIGVAVLAIVLANIIPTQLNALAATTLTNTTANSLWVLLPLLIVVVIVLFVLRK